MQELASPVANRFFAILSLPLSRSLSYTHALSCLTRQQCGQRVDEARIPPQRELRRIRCRRRAGGPRGARSMSGDKMTHDDRGRNEQRNNTKPRNGFAMIHNARERK